MFRSVYSLKIFIFVVIIIYETDNVTTIELTGRNTGNKLDQLVSTILRKYAEEINCLNIVQENLPVKNDYDLMINLANLNYSGTIILMNYYSDVVDDNHSRNNNSFYEILLKNFIFKCEWYIGQLSNFENFLKTYEKVRKNSVYRHTPNFLFLPVDQLENRMKDIFTSYEIQFISNIVVVDVITGEDNNTFSMELLTNDFTKNYNNNNSSVTNNIISLGIWNSNFNKEFYPDKIIDLNGKTIYLATIQYLPYSAITPFDGMEVRLVKEFCLKFNCTIDLVLDNQIWGEIYSNGSADGVLGNVYLDKADIGTGSVYMWESHYKYLEYTSPYSTTRVTCLVPKPLQLPEWQIPLLPFSVQLWIMEIVSVIAAGLILFSVSYFTHSRNEPFIMEFGSFSGSVIRAIGIAFLQPPAEKIPTGSSLRIFFVLFEGLFLLFTTIYAGALSSYLTIPTYYEPIDTPAQMAKENILWVGDHEAWAYSLGGATEKHLKKLYDNFEVHDYDDLRRFGYTRKHGLSIEIMAGGHVTAQQHLSGDLVLNMHVMKQHLYHTALITVVRKGSPYTEKMIKLIQQSLNGGLLLLWESDVTIKHTSSRLQIAIQISRSNSHDDDIMPKKLKLLHIQGAFALLLFGELLAFIIFLAELFAKNKIK